MERDVMTDDLKTKLLEAALPHVAFDGWGEATFRAAVADIGVEPALARAICPRGGLDLAVAYHKAADAAMVQRLKAADLSAMRFRDRVTAAVRWRLEAVTDKEAVRRAVTLFALPHHAAEGARLIWATADLIWTTLGDTSQDLNWYTKRATLSGVYSATVLYWLGDQGPGHMATWAFLDRRIDEVMEIEKVKAKARESALGKAFMAGPGKLFDHIRAPHAPRTDVPGRWGR
jgi:ubiquinone biosynthesis protein COQ9